MIAILFGGPQIQFLRALIYQEVILWAGAFAAAFVYFALCGYYTKRGFTTRIWIGLVLAAGLCLLTRVSIGLGLYVACALLWLQQAWRAWRDREPGPVHIATLAPLLAPAVILTVFVAIAGVINYGRWGNPLTFADSRGYLWPLLHAPDRIERAAEYGNFNLIRLGYGLIYYFFPVWVWRTADGNLLWSDFQRRTIDSVELPPSSFLISDPLIIGLAGFALFQLVRHRNVLNRAVAVPLLAGLFVPVMLILTLISMTFRYRMEFYPLFELCAFLGFGVLLSRRKLPPVAAFGAACVGGIVVSHLLLALYMLTPFGTARTVMRGMDVVTFYRSWFQ
jgi:hypothetical protein